MTLPELMAAPLPPAQWPDPPDDWPDEDVRNYGGDAKPMVERMRKLLWKIKCNQDFWRPRIAAEAEANPPKPCPLCGAERVLDVPNSINQSHTLKRLTLVTSHCATCLGIEWVTDRGVPSSLVHCAFSYEGGKKPWLVQNRDDNDVDYWTRLYVADAVRCRNPLRDAPLHASVMLLHGDGGRGKTHLAVAAFKMFAREAGVRGGSFLCFRDFRSQLRAEYRQRTPGSFVDGLIRSPFVVVDDFVEMGAEDETTAFNGFLLDRIENFRPTLITTNLTREQFMAALGTRMATRIEFSLAKQYALVGPDRRGEFSVQPKPRKEN